MEMSTTDFGAKDKCMEEERWYITTKMCMMESLKMTKHMAMEFTHKRVVKYMKAFGNWINPMVKENKDLSMGVFMKVN